MNYNFLAIVSDEWFKNANLLSSLGLIKMLAYCYYRSLIVWIKDEQIIWYLIISMFVGQEQEQKLHVNLLVNIEILVRLDHDFIGVFLFLFLKYQLVISNILCGKLIFAGFFLMPLVLYINYESWYHDCSIIFVLMFLGAVFFQPQSNIIFIYSKNINFFIEFT